MKILTKPMKSNLFFWACLACSLSTLTGCERKPVPRHHKVAPIQEAVWTGEPGILMDWGHGGDFIYGVLGENDTDEYRLVLRRWKGGTLGKKNIYKIRGALNVVLAKGDIATCSYEDSDEAWPLILFDIQTGQIKMKHFSLCGWHISKSGGSANGRYIAFFEGDGVDAEGYKFPNDRGRVALIDVGKRKLTWVSELNGHGSGTIRRIVVSNDGRYIAIAGWKNGTAMADAKGGKILWAKSPPREISTGYAAFAADGKRIYTVGSEGCVYEIDTATGKILSKLWASPTGESIYGHRASALAFSDDGRWLAVGTGPKGDVYLWNLKGRAKPYVIPHGGGTIEMVAFSPGGESLATVGGGELKVWRLSDFVSGEK